MRSPTAPRPASSPAGSGSRRTTMTTSAAQPVPPNRPARLASPIENLRSRYDAVVIGSGYGGSIAASRLARAGQRVCLLERGREFQPGDYPDTHGRGAQAVPARRRARARRPEDRSLRLPRQPRAGRLPGLRARRHLARERGCRASGRAARAGRPGLAAGAPRRRCGRHRRPGTTARQRCSGRRRTRRASRRSRSSAPSRRPATISASASTGRRSTSTTRTASTTSACTSRPAASAVTASAAATTRPRTR